MVEGEVKLVSLGNLNYSMWISCDLIDNRSLIVDITEFFQLALPQYEVSEYFDYCFSSHSSYGI